MHSSIQYQYFWRKKKKNSSSRYSKICIFIVMEMIPIPKIQGSTWELNHKGVVHVTRNFIFSGQPDYDHFSRSSFGVIVANSSWSSTTCDIEICESLLLPHITKYNPQTITTAPTTLPSHNIPSISHQIITLQTSKLNYKGTYFPTSSSSMKMKELSTATITILKGLNAVTNTGPFSLIMTPDT